MPTNNTNDPINNADPSENTVGADPSENTIGGAQPMTADPSEGEGSIQDQEEGGGAVAAE